MRLRLSGLLLQRAILPGLTVILVCSCSNARKSKDQSSPLIAEVIGEPALSEEQIAELKKIADAPNSQLEEDSIEDTPTATPPVDPSLAWKKGDFQPRSIQPGDIFFEQSGAILHKAASISDTYSGDQWQTVLASYGDQKDRIVPLTLSQEEIIELTDQTGGRIELPSRSVALDFKTKRTEIKARKLESYLQEVMTGSSPADNGANQEVLSECLAEVKSRLAKGEEFYVITAVTSSESVRATYPGAPVGKRDAQLILNALLALYPHLDQLAAEKKDNAIVVTRDPKIHWEYEASPLVLENGKLKIETTDSAPLFSQFSFRKSIARPSLSMNRLVNEFIGTFFLVFTICVAAVYGRAGDYAPIAIGFVLVAVVYAGGHISKAHYNPAVSLAFLIRGCYISVREMFGFIAVQILGALLATGLAMAFFSDGAEVATVEMLPTPALISEILFTFMLVWVIMNVATVKANQGNQFYGIAIGFTVTGAIYTVGIYSLAVLNPAVAVSLWMIGKLSLSQMWIPMAGSFIGSLIAVTAFNAGHPNEKCHGDQSGCQPIDE